MLDGGIRISDEVVRNQAGQKEETQKGINLKYRKGEDDVLFLVRKLYSCESEAMMFEYSAWDKVEQENGITFYYSRDTYKTVPDDYEITEEDKAGMESGKLQIAYDGGQDTEVQQAYYVGWIKDGKVYSINGFDLSISADEMLGMAKEVAGCGN